MTQKTFWLTLFSLSALSLGAGFSGASGAAETADPTAYDKEIRPLLKQFCNDCHGPDKAHGGVNLAKYDSVAALQKDQTTWRKVLTQVRERSMPPPGMPQPTDMQRGRLTQWLTQTLNSVDESLLPKNPGRTVIRRLSRLEYNNTVRDLLGVDTRPADAFPSDSGGGGGFDNNADTLFVPPILMERYLETAGDLLRAAPPARLFPVRPTPKITRRAAARASIERFASRAYRRPVDNGELAILMRLYDQATASGATFDDAVRLSLKATLVSPNFLFRIEKDQPGKAAYAIGDYELASRLSYFLWASMPDDALLKLAAAKRLRDPAVLDQQVNRMLRDPKSRALAESFAGQWLRVRDLYTTAKPDPGRFPNFTPSLRDALYNETITFIGGIFQSDTSVLQILDADYTYLNEELAKHYGIAGVTGPQLRRVHLSDGRRGGVLTMGSVLTLTSYPVRTSPVLRGKWVLDEIFGTPPPPPPANVKVLSQNDAPEAGLTFRQRLEKHREDPQCASCHARMDPIGFGLENFDPTGRWRDEIGGQKVDASGSMATGEKFSGPGELKKIVLNRKEDFVRNLTERMLSYALGRGIEPYDLPTVRKITTALEKDDYRSSTLIREIVKSYPFQYRKGNNP